MRSGHAEDGEAARASADGREERLRGILEREEAATRGPWRAVVGELWDRDGEDVSQSSVQSGSAPITWDDHGGEVFKPTDAEFIAHARDDVPWLHAEVTRQDDVIKAVLGLHRPEQRTEYNVPTFDEFDSPTRVVNGCSCGTSYYPCQTVQAIERSQS